jgi:hypothetical protein
MDDDTDTIDLTDHVELQGVIYCVAEEAVIIMFSVDGGRRGRVCIPLREFFDRAVDARPEQQVTLN